MTVYIALDDDNGMMFNHRRQSRDRIMRQHMLDDCANRLLWIAKYSKCLFFLQDGTSLPSNINVDDEFLDKAGPNDCCFVENRSLTPYMDKIDTLVIFRWNCNYPDDFYFDASVLDSNWKKTSKTKFSGSSHDLITKEVWKRA